MLRMAREALIYLSLAMRREEEIRHEKDHDPNEIIPSVGSSEIEMEDMI